MSDNPLLRKLERLYNIAILREEEETNEARVNEARTAAFLLIKTARENGVKLRFEVPKRASPKPATVTNPAPTSPWPPYQTKAPNGQGFEDFFADLMRNARVNFKEAGVYVDTDEVEPSPFVRPQRTTTRRAKSAPSATGKPPLIKSKFHTACMACGDEVLVGSQVWWVQGIGVTHEACGFEELLKYDRATGTRL